MNTPFSIVASAVSDKLGTTEQEKPTMYLSYTFDMNKGDQTDTNDRFFPVERLVRLQVRDSSEDTKVYNADLFERSFLEHFDAANYASPTYQPSFTSSKALLLYYTGNDAVDGTKWLELSGRNQTNNTIICGGATGSDYTLTNISGTAATFPDAFLLLVKDKKFNKVHFRVKNTLRYEESIGDAIASCKLNVWYSSSSGWKPLSFVDNTITEKVNTGIAGHSLHTSGSIIFDSPSDWLATTSRKNTKDGGYGVSNFISDIVNDGTGSDDPHNHWTFDGYALLVGIAVEEELATKINVMYAQTYDNTHSQVIKIVDPMHISLNTFGIIENISYNRSGSYVRISDRLGREEIRKIGASGGNIRISGIDTASTTERSKAVDYQKNSVPVYVDVKRPDSSYIRFYGVVTSLSETTPVGKGLSKFSMDLSIENIIEYTSTGTWEHILSLGGFIENEPSYIL